MNRREFIKRTLTGIAGLALTIDETLIDKLVNETIHLNENEFVTYINFYVNMWVSNPSKCAIITNIEEP